MFQSNQSMDQENKPDINDGNSASVNSQVNNNIPKSLSPVMIAQVMDKGQAQPIQQSSKQVQSEYPQYDWDNKWLKGDEYANMLEKIEEYCHLYKLEKYTKKTHPEDIYRSPQNGLIYFVEGNCVGSEFGFPRVPFRKQYRWKKMNFTTDLPKKRPQVTYIVASSVKCQKQTGNEKNKQENNKKEQDVYRMHAVILYKNSQNNQNKQQSQSPLLENNNNAPQNANNITASSTPRLVSDTKQYILCHIRKMDINEDDKILSNKPSTNNNSSASASSQDLAPSSNSAKIKRVNKMKKLSNSGQFEEAAEDEDEDEYESDDINEDEGAEIKSNQVQNKRKNSSMINENRSKHDSLGNQNPGQLCRVDSNKSSKAKSKYLNKQQQQQQNNNNNNNNDNFQRQQFNLNQKQGAVADTSPEQPTDFLQVKTTNKVSQQGVQQGQQEDLSKQAGMNIDKINKKVKLDEGNMPVQDQSNNYQQQQNQQQNNNQLRRSDASSFRNSIPNGQIGQSFSNSTQIINQLIQHQSPNNSRQRSPGNCELNSLTSSSNTNQNKDEELQQNIMSAIGVQQSMIPTNNNFRSSLFGNQLYANNQISYPTQNGLMMMQPYPAIQAAQSISYPHVPPIYMIMSTDQANMQSQQNQYQAQLQQQLLQIQQTFQNFIRPYTPNMDILSFVLNNSQNPQQDIDYRNLFSMQMNNFPKNSAFLPNQGNNNNQQ